MRKCLQLILDQNNVDTVELPEGITREQFIILNKQTRINMISSFNSNLITHYNRDPMKAIISNYVAQGLKVVLFGHGTGTQVSNGIYLYMSTADKDSIAQVSIAPYVT